MPLRYPQSPPHLSRILKLYPEQEPRCAGYAPTQGRRCRCQTNACGRRDAELLLDEGTEGLQAGKNIDDILEDLAPHVLCTRWHQYHASELVGKWQRRVERFLDTAVPMEPVRITRSGETRRERRAPDNSEQRWPSSLEEIIRLMEELDARRSANATVRHTRDNGADETRRNVAGNVVRTRTRTRTLHSTHTVQEDEDTHSDEDTRSDEEEDTRQDDQGATPESASIYPSNNATRRTIEGECNICLEPLRGLDASESQSDEPGDGEEEQGLSWCKVQCGVNYHSSCINGWLASAAHATCPTCRASWED